MTDTEHCDAEASQPLTEAKLRADHLNQAKSQFLMSLSHEMRTPLTSILGYTDMLLEEQWHTAHKKWLNTIRRNADRLLSIVDDVLDLTGLESGGTTAEFDSVNPFIIVQEVYSTFAIPAAKKGIELQVHCDGRIPDRIETDPSHLKMILHHLVDNAVRHTDSGNVSVTLRSEAMEESSVPVMRFTVRDTGCGIAESRLPGIFTPFGNSSNDESSTNEGTGLGLAIVQHLVRLLEGDIEVQSNVGDGSTFTLTIRTLRHRPEGTVPQSSHESQVA